MHNMTTDIILSAGALLIFICAIARGIHKWKRDKEEYEYFKRENDKYRNK